MKNNFVMGLIAMFILSIISCEKSADPSFTEPDSVLQALTNTTVESQDAFVSIEDLENDILESRDGGACPMITSTAPKGIFPVVVTIDFGTGCIAKNGRFHSGKIIIEQSDSIRNNGAVRKTTFEDFGIDSLRMKNGTVVLKNEGPNDNGNPKFTRKITGMVIEGPNGMVTINAIHVRTLLKGDDTKDREDDIWRIEGETIGTSDDKVIFSAYIREALVRKGDCPFIVAGKEVVTRKGHTAVIDYGDGTCDRFAIATLENGNKRIIKLRPRD